MPYYLPCAVQPCPYTHPQHLSNFCTSVSRTCPATMAQEQQA